LGGGAGAPGSVAAVARELGRTAGILEPIQSRDSVAGLIEELDEQLRECVQKPLLLIGHSWGAWLALLYAARLLELARRIVLVGAGPLDERYARHIAERRRARLTPEQDADFAAAIATLENTAEGSIRAEAMLRLATLTKLTDHIHLREPAEQEADDALPADARQYASVWPEAARLRADGSLLEAARSLLCPVTVLHGADDPHPPEGVTEPLAAAGVSFTSSIYPSCGHEPFHEKYAADVFYNELAGLLR
ncbi:MAG: alpha/beta hydrolase, partial [Planctomycetes bacterium]|nr:alpha/beta hydrolase [Planctomycetota bacterium]